LAVLWIQGFVYFGVRAVRFLNLLLLVNKAFVKLIIPEVVTRVFYKLIGFTKSATQVLLVLVDNVLKFGILFLDRLQGHICILFLFIFEFIRIEIITVIIFFFFGDIELF